MIFRNGNAMPRRPLALIVLMFFAPAAYVQEASSSGGARILHVENNGTESATCGSQPAPCRSISRAMARAGSGDTILVGPGRYGDFDASGNLEPGSERPDRDGECLLCIDKRVTVISTHGADQTSIQEPD